MTASPFATFVQAARWYQANPLATFKPSPALAEFWTDESPRILVRLPNRMGKTYQAAAKLAATMLRYPNRRYRIAGTDFKQTQLVAGGYLHRLLPKSALTSSSRFSEQRGWNYELIELNNGTTCEIRTYEQRPDQHAGGDMDGVWLDEPPPPLIWGEALRRVFSRRGFLWLTFTPLGREVGWLRKIVESEGSGWREYTAELNTTNCPWYSKEQIEKWKNEVRTSMPDAYEQTIKGAWEGITSERTFTGYDSSCHMAADAALPSGVRFGVGVDHGEGAGKQVAILLAWLGEGKESRIWVLDEAVSKTVTRSDQDAHAIAEMLRRNGLEVAGVHRWRGDINTAGKGNAGQSANEILAQHLAQVAGYKRFPREFEAAEKSAVLKGEMLLNGALLQGRALIRAERCPVLCRALAHYNGQEDLKHPLDALRYIATPVLDPGEELPSLGSVSLGFRF